MTTMTQKKKKTDPPPKPRVVRSGKNLNLWIDPQVRQRLDDFIAAHEPRTSLTAVVEAAIKRYLDAVTGKI